MLEDLEDDIVHSAILHNSKIDIVYNPVNNRNIESGMMPLRKNIMPLRGLKQINKIWKLIKPQLCLSKIQKMAINVMT